MRRRPAASILPEEFPVSNVCQVTGRRPAFGNNVSHSHRKTRRRWNPNVQRKRYWVPSEKRWVTLTLSAKGIKIIDKQGIEKVLADLRRRGEKV
jgi:large subunit ribosomal protein L28